MNRVFLFLFAIGFGVAAWHQLVDPAPLPLPDGTVPLAPMDALTKGMMDAAKGAVELAIGLIGPMTLFLGLMKVAEAGGLMTIIAGLLRPVLLVLFPDVPPGHPAMGAIVLNFAANALGLGNAATPFGIRAIHELDALNREKGTATNAMILFLAINTSSITLLPSGVIGIRAAMGSTDAAGILPTTLLATTFSTLTAIVAAKLFQRLTPDTGGAPDDRVDTEPSTAPIWPLWTSALALAGVGGLIAASVAIGPAMSPWVVPVLAVSLLGFGAIRGVAVYEAFVDGAKEGFQVAIRIVPYLVGVLVAVAMFRSSGALDTFTSMLGPWTSPLGLPAEALPMVLIRPLSGSGALAVMSSLMETYGVDSYVGYLVSTIQGSTETTFYVLAIYFGAVGVKRTRHMVPTALLSELAGVIGAVIAVQLWLA